MNKPRRLFLLSLVLGALASCSIANSSSVSSSSQTSAGDQGYLKITRNASGYFDTDYLFVSENGYEFFAKGKREDGSAANYTYSATWSTSDPSVVVIDSFARAKALKDGSAVITAEYGPYRDEFPVEVRTFASAHTVHDAEEEYRTGRTYGLPVVTEPENALVVYAFSEEDAVELVDHDHFIPRKAGAIEARAKVYVNYDGRSREYPFTLNIVDDDTPYFTHDDERVKEAVVEVPVNKFSALDFPAWGIAAHAGADDADITEAIVVKEGTYDLHQVGEYPLTLAVTDKGLEATLPFTLKVIERETVVTKVQQSLTITTLTYSVASNLKSVHFSMAAPLPTEHEEYMGDVGFYVSFDAKRNVSGAIETLDKYESKYFDRTSPRTIAVSFDVPSPGNIDLRAGKENIKIRRTFAELHGYGYDYIVYE